MRKLAIEFATENLEYKILIIPKITDISYNIEFQKSLYSKTEDKVKKNIISKRIRELKEMVGNEELIENEYYIMIWFNEGEEEKLQKRVKEWENRLNICNFETKVIEQNEISKLIQSFTMPEIKNENIQYNKGVMKIERRVNAKE